MAQPENEAGRPGPGHTAIKDQSRGRLARVEGQVCSVAQMVKDDPSCCHVLALIAAIQVALDKIPFGVLDLKIVLGGHGTYA